jgi:hypothetical protein
MSADRAQQWFVRVQGGQKGPFSSRQLKAFAAQQKLLPQTLVRRGDREDWLRAESIRGLFADPVDVPENKSRVKQEEFTNATAERLGPSSTGTVSTARAAASASNEGDSRQEFISFLSSEHDVKPLHRFKARAALAKTLPRFAWAFPIGDVILYPRFLVFLTSETNSPGSALALKNFASKMIGVGPPDLMSVIENFCDKASNAIKDDTLLRKVVDNPHSCCIPVRTLAQLDYFRGYPVLRTNRIKIDFAGKSLYLCQDRDAEFGADWTVMTGRWHMDFVETVRGLIERNKATPS